MFFSLVRNHPFDDGNKRTALIAIAEKLAALLTEEYLDERAKRASRERFDEALSKVADIEPEDVDRLKSGL